MDLQVFKHNDFGLVRVIDINGEPWFVGKEVAEILGYSNTRDALSKLDEQDKRKLDIQTSENTTFDSKTKWMTVVNESGLYSLIFSSKKLEAKKFKRWVMSEVLPSIRKHGLYAIDDVLSNPDSLITALTALKKERAKNNALVQANLEQKQIISDQMPKVTYYDLILQSTGLVTTTQIAKDYGMSAKRLNKILQEHRIQFKQGGVWYLYQNHAEKGYMKSKTVMGRGKGSNNCYCNNYWTQAGRLFLYGVLRDLGYMPIMDTEKGILWTNKNQQI